jgi:hypothetical protein
MDISENRKVSYLCQKLNPGSSSLSVCLSVSPPLLSLSLSLSLSVSVSVSAVVFACDQPRALSLVQVLTTNIAISTVAGKLEQNMWKHMEEGM